MWPKRANRSQLPVILWCSCRPQDDWNIRGGRFAREACSGVDRLGYSIYAETLAGLFTTTGEENDLPAAVGIYAPWGAGKVWHHSPLEHSGERKQ